MSRGERLRLHVCVKVFDASSLTENLFQMLTRIKPPVMSSFTTPLKATSRPWRIKMRKCKSKLEQHLHKTQIGHLRTSTELCGALKMRQSDHQDLTACACVRITKIDLKTPLRCNMWVITSCDPCTSHDTFEMQHVGEHKLRSGKWPDTPPRGQVVPAQHNRAADCGASLPAKVCRGATQAAGWQPRNRWHLKGYRCSGPSYPAMHYNIIYIILYRR